jgi:hypothetical protein
VDSQDARAEHAAAVFARMKNRTKLAITMRILFAYAVVIAHKSRSELKSAKLAFDELHSLPQEAREWWCSY